MTGLLAGGGSSSGSGLDEAAVQALIDAAVAAKAPLASPTFTGNPAAPTPSAADSDTSVATTAFVQGEITAKAPLASPTFTGTPAAPTAAAATNTTQLATTAFVRTAVSGVVASTMSTVSVSNTTSESDLVNLNIPTSVAAGDILRLTAFGAHTNNSGSNYFYLPKIRVGSTDIFTAPAGASLVTNASARGWYATVDIFVITPASSQIIGAFYWVSNNTGVFGASANSFTDARAGGGTAAEDLTTGPKAVKLTLTMSGAHASASSSCYGASLIRLRA